MRAHTIILQNATVDRRNVELRRQIIECLARSAALRFSIPGEDRTRKYCAADRHKRGGTTGPSENGSAGRVYDHSGGTRKLAIKKNSEEFQSIRVRYSARHTCLPQMNKVN